jgi:hypothetical protein
MPLKKTIITYLPQIHSTSDAGNISQRHIYLYIKHVIEQAIQKKKVTYFHIFVESTCDHLEFTTQDRVRELDDQYHELNVPRNHQERQRIQEEIGFLKELLLFKYDLEKFIETLSYEQKQYIDVQYIEVPCFNIEKVIRTRLEESKLNYYHEILDLIQSYGLDRYSVYIHLNEIQQRQRQHDIPNEIDEIFKFSIENYQNTDNPALDIYIQFKNNYNCNIRQLLDNLNYKYPIKHSKKLIQRFEKKLKELLLRNPIIISREYLTILEIIQYILKLNSKLNHQCILIFGRGHEFELWNDYLKTSVIQFKRPKSGNFPKHQKPFTHPENYRRKSIESFIQVNNQFKIDRPGFHHELFKIHSVPIVLNAQFFPIILQYLNNTIDPRKQIHIFYQSNCTPKDFNLKHGSVLQKNAIGSMFDLLSRINAQHRIFRFIPVPCFNQNANIQYKLAASMKNYKSKIRNTLDKYNLNQYIPFFENFKSDVELLNAFSLANFDLPTFLNLDMSMYPNNISKELTGAILQTVTFNSVEYMTIKEIITYFQNVYDNLMENKQSKDHHFMDRNQFFILFDRIHNFGHWNEYTIPHKFLKFIETNDPRLRTQSPFDERYPHKYYKYKDSRRQSILRFVKNLEYTL